MDDWTLCITTYQLISLQRPCISTISAYLLQFLLAWRQRICSLSEPQQMPDQYQDYHSWVPLVLLCQVRSGFSPPHLQSICKFRITKLLGKQFNGLSCITNSCMLFWRKEIYIKEGIKPHVCQLSHVPWPVISYDQHFSANWTIFKLTALAHNEELKDYMSYQWDKC